MIPCAAESNLLAAGRWLKVNGDAVYGAGRSPFGEGLADYRTVTDANGRKTRLPFLDWRCTTRPGKLYFTIFHWPGNGFRLPAFKNEVKRAYLLGDPRPQRSGGDGGQGDSDRSDAALRPERDGQRAGG